MAPYLFLGFLPVSLTNKSTTQGYRAAKHDFTFKNCDANPNSYITFYYNPNKTYPGRVGVSNNFMNGWINWSSTLSQSEYMNNEFFFDFEMHMGGCGGFMTSYSVNNISTALGLPVYKDYTQTSSTVIRTSTVLTTDAVVVTNATTSPLTNKDMNEIGMVIGLVVGLVLFILVLVVISIFIRRSFGSNKLKESKECYTGSQNNDMARETGLPNNTQYLDLKKDNYRLSLPKPRKPCSFW
ncbi:uncharacterized protein LOC127710092 [Mytilus californianus]|uniref:uncharacterized protein LOC127710092 n=1 Tax=Mytilus californianus TaxID=6549 RepID=UPI002245F90C|nr:uncharacterized protein LOC127710092 [Mytilus californianus]